jgi:CDP-4-dehydro-6-deoxyglucose reductase
MATIRLHPSGHEVEAKPGDTVLAALERAGYALPNNCRAGACGECKTKVLDGRYDQGMVLTMALSDQERAEGYGLMCMATPLSDLVVIEYGTDDARPRLFPPRTGVAFLVVDRIPRTERIVEVRLRPLGDPLRYWPGQYVLLGDPEAGAPPRCYSIANAPRPDGEIHLLVSRTPEGRTSAWVHDRLAVGDQVSLDGPYGTFVGDPATDTPVLCLAAGSGLAPILALTDAALRRGFPHPVTLVFSARSAGDELAVGLLRWWQATHPNLRVVVTYTGDAPPKGATTGRVPELLASLAPDLSGTSVFIAGSPDFVDGCAAAARRLGVPEHLLHTEGFVSQQVPEAPPAERLLAG